MAMVARDVITISRQVGSGGDEIALKVCKILGYNYFDKNLLVVVAKSLGVSEEDIADFSEDDYKIKSLVNRILRRKRIVVSSCKREGDELIRKALDEQDSLAVIQAVINNLAIKGKTVIVGRGGQAILKDKVGVLHVRIVAPLDIRVGRIMKGGGLSEKDALKIIENNDKATAEYLRRFYKVDYQDPTIYDMVLNTWKMDYDTAARLVASVVWKMF
jgi:cytidylate kinase